MCEALYNGVVCIQQALPTHKSVHEAAAIMQGHTVVATVWPIFTRCYAGCSILVDLRHKTGYMTQLYKTFQVALFFMLQLKQYVPSSCGSVTRPYQFMKLFVSYICTRQAQYLHA